MRTLFVLAAFVALVAVVGVSTSFGDDQDMIQQQLQVQLQLKDGSCLECVCATFVDEDGDGICDECRLPRPTAMTTTATGSPTVRMTTTCRRKMTRAVSIEEASNTNEKRPPVERGLSLDRRPFHFTAFPCIPLWKLRRSFMPHRLSMVRPTRGAGISGSLSVERSGHFHAGVMARGRGVDGLGITGGSARGSGAGESATI